MRGAESLQQSLDDLLAQAGLAGVTPIELTLAERLLQRAKREREAVADLLYQRAQNQIERAKAVLDNAEQTSTVPPRDESPLSALLKELGGHQQEEKTPQKSEFEIKLDKQLSRLSGLEVPQIPATEQTDRNPLRAAKQLRLEQRHQFKKQKVRLALNNRPENPGPLNPQMLAVKILSELQDISPVYLEHLASYMDTLAMLEQQYATRSKKGKKRARKQNR